MLWLRLFDRFFECSVTFDLLFYALVVVFLHFLDSFLVDGILSFLLRCGSHAWGYIHDSVHQQHVLHRDFTLLDCHNVLRMGLWQDLPTLSHALS